MTKLFIRIYSILLASSPSKQFHVKIHIYFFLSISTFSFLFPTSNHPTKYRSGFNKFVLIIYNVSFLTFNTVTSGPYLKINVNRHKRDVP